MIYIYKCTSLWSATVYLHITSFKMKPFIEIQLLLNYINMKIQTIFQKDAVEIQEFFEKITTTNEHTAHSTQTHKMLAIKLK